MNLRLLFAFLCVAAFSTGCIIHQEDNDSCCHTPPRPAQPGDVTFLWTFANLRCDEVRDVYGVNITIAGEQLHNDGRYACTTAGVDGITLHDFVPGSYPFKIQGVDYRGVVMFEATGTFVIDGDARVNVDLMPVGNPTSYALLNWRFPGNQSCAAAGITSVDVTIDEQSKTFPCFEGQSASGVQSPPLAPGEHFIEFIARDSAGRPLYYFNGGLVTQAYRPSNHLYDLYAVGGASISWKFNDGSVNFDCAQADPANNLQIGVNFLDTNTNQWVYGALGDWHLCRSKPILYSFLKPGTYKISLQTTISGTRYCSNPAIAPVLIQAHVFPGSADALEVSMEPRHCR
jgi:hypothetical protein